MTDSAKWAKDCAHQIAGYLSVDRGWNTEQMLKCAQEILRSEFLMDALTAARKERFALGAGLQRDAGADFMESEGQSGYGHHIRLTPLRQPAQDWLKGVKAQVEAQAYRRCAANMAAHPHFAGTFLKWADAADLERARASRDQ